MITAANRKSQYTVAIDQSEHGLEHGVFQTKKFGFVYIHFV